MSSTATRTSGDPTPVTGGISPSAHLLRPVAVPPTAAPADALGKHILRLLALHKDILVKFRSTDLTAMDDAAKRALLDKINSVLGVKRIKPPTA